MTKKIIYAEPSDYFPENVRKELKIVEYEESKSESVKKLSKIDIAKKLENPNLSNAERNKLMDKLYDGIEFKKEKVRDVTEDI